MLTNEEADALRDAVNAWQDVKNGRESKAIALHRAINRCRPLTAAAVMATAPVTIHIAASETDPALVATMEDISKLAEDGALCPSCGNPTLITSFGLMGGGYGPYVGCDTTNCGFFKKAPIADGDE